MQMATRQRKGLPPSFFKVIRDPSAPHLSLPKAFVRRYLENIRKNPILVTETKEHSWKLEIVKIGEDHCFANGWEKLVKDVQLRIRDIVLFWLVNPFTFNVLFLDANGCEKDLPFIKTNVLDDDDDVTDEVQGANVVGEFHEEVKPAKNLCFQKVISRKTHRYSMVVPIKFVKAAGLEHVSDVTVKDLEGNEWGMRLMAERYTSTKYSLAAGWLRFREYHRLSDGDLCKFRFNKKEGVINLTHVFKNKRPVIQETSKEEVNRNRVRPPCYSGARGKVEDEWYPTEKPPCGRDGGSSSGGGEMEVVKRKTGMLTPEGGGAVVKPPVSGADQVFKSKHVIYF